MLMILTGLTAVIVLNQETLPKHTKGGMIGITQARGRLQVVLIYHDTSSKKVGSITIRLIEVQRDIEGLTKIKRVR